MDTDEIDGRTLDSLGHKVIAMTLIAAGSAGCERDARAVNDLFHVASSTAKPVVRVVVGCLIFRLLERFILDIKRENRVRPLTPGFSAARRLIVEHMGHTSVISVQMSVVKLGTVIAWIRTVTGQLYSSRSCPPQSWCCHSHTPCHRRRRS